MDHVDRTGEGGGAEYTGAAPRRTSMRSTLVRLIASIGDEPPPAGMPSMSSSRSSTSRTPSSPNRPCRAGIAARCDADAAEQRQRGAQISGAAGPYLVTGDHADRTGYFRDRFTKARRRDLNRVLEGRRVLRRRRLRLRVRGSGSGSGSGKERCDQGQRNSLVDVHVVVSCE